MARQVAPLCNTPHDLLEFPPVKALLKRIDETWWPNDEPTYECLAVTRPLRFLDQFDGMDRIGLQFFYINGVLCRRFLSGSLRRSLNEVKLCQELAAFFALNREKDRAKYEALMAWYAGPFKADSANLEASMEKAALATPGRVLARNANLRATPLAFAAWLLDVLDAPLSQAEIDRYWAQPELIDEDIVRAGTGMNRRARNFIFSAKRFERGARKHGLDRGTFEIFDGDIIEHPERISQYYGFLGEATTIGVITKHGLEIGDLLVKSALDARYGRKSRAAERLVLEADFAPDKCPQAVSQDTAEYTASLAELRETIASVNLDALLRGVFTGLASQLVADQECAIELFSYMTKLINLVAATNERALAAAILFEGTRGRSLHGVFSRTMIAHHFGVSVVSLRRKAEHARAALATAGLRAA